MTLEKLIEEARARRSPEEQAEINKGYRERMQALDQKLRREFKAQEVTQELLNRVISL